MLTTAVLTGSAFGQVLNIDRYYYRIGNTALTTTQEMLRCFSLMERALDFAGCTTWSLLANFAIPVDAAVSMHMSQMTLHICCQIRQAYTKKLQF